MQNRVQKFWNDVHSVSNKSPTIFFPKYFCTALYNRNMPKNVSPIFFLKK